MNLSINCLPGIKMLLDHEKLARKEGSGIQLDSLIGSWKFHTVWNQGSERPDSISSSFLRLVSANLTLTKLAISKDSENIVIKNSIRLGFFSLLFTGFASLRNKQPILSFYFDQVEVKLGKTVLINRALEKPAEKETPFFSLISMEENGKWLSARGKGGGLAIWLKS